MGRNMRSAFAVLGAAAALALVPAAASGAGLIAAHDTFATGQGFDIRLINAATGAQITLPAGVNTTDDELHPALSADGRFLVWTRMKLQPKLNGDIEPPTQRTLHWLDRETGEITQLTTDGVGPVFTSLTATSTALSWGITPFFEESSFQSTEGDTHVARTTGLATLPPTSGSQPIRASVTRTNLDVPHAASIANLFSVQSTCGGSPCSLGRTARYLTLAYHTPASGALEQSVVRISAMGFPNGFTNSQVTVDSLTFGGPGAPAGHPMPRSGDAYTALDLANGADVDIQTISYPDERELTPAPTPITTADPERMPAWSPDGIKLGFVRTTADGRRTLGIFDATPGLQTLVNTPVDIGPDAPTPQTRQFQSVYGGMSIANSSALDVPNVTCGSACIGGIVGSPIRSAIRLTPRVSSTRRGQRIGIFVVRVRGKAKRTLLGRKVARISVVGRVPLGATRKGTNRFRWNGKVDGRRLPKGTYLLTYRALHGDRVVSTSDSIRFKVKRNGKFAGARRER